MQEIWVILVGGVAGLFPIILTAAISWSERRSMISKRNTALNLAHKRVDFLASWIKTQELVSNPDNLQEIKVSVSDELSCIRKNLEIILGEENKREQERIESSIDNLTWTQKTFLLYSPTNLAGWISRTLFTVSVGITLAFVIVAIFAATSPTATKGAVAGLFVCFTPFIFFNLLFYLIARTTGSKVAKEPESRQAS